MNQKYKVFDNDRWVNIQSEEEWKSFCSRYIIIEAAGGLVKNKKGEMLFIFRKGKWDLPKGKIEKGEYTQQAALREVEEECGISGVQIVKPLVTTYHTYELKGENVLKRTWWFEMIGEASELKPQIEEDITEVKWIAPADLKPVFANTYPSITEVLQSANSSV